MQIITSSLSSYAPDTIKKWAIARRLPLDSISQGVYLNLYR